MFPYHGPVETFNFVAGALMNVILIVLIRNFSRKELGGYKYLIAIFALQDIFLVLADAICNVTPYRVGPIVGVISRTFWESKHVTSFYCAINALPFILTNVNFLYRYWTIKSPERILFFSSRLFQGGLFSIGASAILAWYFMGLYVATGVVDEPATIALRDSFATKYNLTIYDGWIVMDHWRNNTFALRPFVIVLGCDVIMTCALLTQIVLASMTFYYIHVNTTLSDCYRKSQKTVLIALCAQTLVPLILVYIPYTNSINAPFFGWDDVMADNDIVASFISAFPLLDALVIILLMKDYRIGAMRLLIPCGRGKTADASLSRITSSSVAAISPSQVRSL